MCPKFAAPQYEKSSIQIKHIQLRLVPEWDPDWVPDDKIDLRDGIQGGSMAPGNARRQGRELLVLGLGREDFVGTGVIDDIAQQLLPEWSQRTLP